jgi:hypothetical protein
MAEARHHSLLLEQLADERTKKGSLEQRGLAVISTAGTLVAIILGFVALATRNPSSSLPGTAALLLLIALLVLVIASAAGLLVNLPARTPIVDAEGLVAMADHADWNRPDPETARTEYRLQGQMLIALRKVNRVRARVLISALLLEVLALTLMATSAVVALWPTL